MAVTFHPLLIKFVIPLSVAIAATTAARLAVDRLDWPNHLEKSVQLSRVDSLRIKPSYKIVVVAISPESGEKLGLDEGAQIGVAQFHEFVELLDRHEQTTVLLDVVLGAPGLQETPPLTKAGKEFAKLLKRIERTNVVLGTRFIQEKEFPGLYDALLDESEPNGSKAYTQPLTVWHGPPSAKVYPGLLEYLQVSDFAFGASLARQDVRTGRLVLYAPVAAILMNRAVQPTSVEVLENEGLVVAGPLKWRIDGNHSVDVRYTQKRNPFHTVDFADAMLSLRNGDAAMFRDNIAVVGFVGLADEVFTRPFGPIDGCEFKAHMVNTLLSEANRGVRWTPDWFGIAYVFLFAAGIAFSLASSSKVFATAGPLILCGLAVAAPYLSEMNWRLYLETVAPGISIAVSLIASLAMTLALGFRRDLRVAGSVAETTVLFGDVTGSTQRLVEMGSPKYRLEVERLLVRVAKVVDQHYGRLERTLGDGFIATFTGKRGALHVDRAVATVLEIQRESAGRTVLEMRFGLETGPVTGGYVIEGGERRWSSTGRAVNLAQRIQSATSELGIVVGIGPYASMLLAERMEVVLVKAITAKGFEQTVAVSTFVR
jgi:class 3 adenylate cyclase